MANVKRVILVGPTGTGKSRLGNKLLDGQFFKSSSSPNSVTKECDAKSNSVTMPDKKSTLTLTVVDTPGLGDSDGETSEFMDKIIEYARKEKVDMFIIVMAHGRMNTGIQNNLKVLKECLRGFDDNSTALVINKIPTQDTLDEDFTGKKVADIEKEDREAIEKQLGCTFANVVFIPMEVNHGFQLPVQKLWAVIGQAKGMDKSTLQTWTERIKYYESVKDGKIDAVAAHEKRIKDTESEQRRLINDREWHEQRKNDCTIATGATAWIPFVGPISTIGFAAAIIDSINKISDIDANLELLKQKLKELKSRKADGDKEKQAASEKLAEMRNIIK